MKRRILTLEPWLLKTKVMDLTAGLTAGTMTGKLSSLSRQFSRFQGRNLLEDLPIHA